MLILSIMPQEAKCQVQLRKHEDTPLHIFLATPDVQSAQHHSHLTFSRIMELLQNFYLNMVKVYSL